MNYTNVDWRDVLKKNQRKTIFIFSIFIILYVFIGLFLDLYFRANMYHAPLDLILFALLTFKIKPYFTIIFSAVALISIIITLLFHNSLILLGTEYKEISPNNFNDLLEKQIYNTIEEMKIAASLNFMPKIYIINAPYMNAFASGFNEKNAMIAITRGLAEKLDRDELQAVLSHELNHIRHGDIKLTLSVSLLSNIMLMVIDMLFWSTILGGINSNSNSDDRQKNNQLMIIILILRYILPIMTFLLILFLSRTREYMADAGAVELMRSNQPLGRALLKISQDHNKNTSKYQRFYQNNNCEYFRQQAYIFDPKQAGISISSSFNELLSTHPSIENRLKSIGY